jgi:hypothetical protein
MIDATKGNCFCGAIEIEAIGAPVEMGYCHCNSCRSYSGSPVNAYLLCGRQKTSGSRRERNWSATLKKRK